MRPEGFRAAAVLLAAGLSRRMGERNKLLIEIAGEPLVRHAARVYLAAGIEVHAVLGHDAERVGAALEGLPISIVENARYTVGQQSSVRAGIESLGPGYGAVLIALADQPALTPTDIEDLLAAFIRSGGNRILVPYFQGQRGNPIVIPPHLLDRMRASGANVACRGFIRDNPHLAGRYEASHGRFVIDIDTPGDLASFEERSMPGSLSH